MSLRAKPYYINRMLKKPQNMRAVDAVLAEVTERYAVAVTPHVLSTMDLANPDDPVARQYLPSAKELETTPDELVDPTGDDAHTPVKGIVHRYPDRVLLKPLHVCAVYCRFCFRREKVGPGSEFLTELELEAALDYIRAHDEIWEVILTGGDPLILSPRRLQRLMTALGDIPHVQVIRIHSRLPIADPARITADLVAALGSEKAVYIVLHCNHARELVDAVRDAAQKFISAGISLLSQSVLLKGVNNDAATLDTLFRKLVTMKIKPYYLHHPDLAPGTGHFRVTIAEGQEIMRQLRGRLSGIAQPLYVLDIPGGHGKVPAGDAWITGEAGDYDLRDYQGGTHKYK